MSRSVRERSIGLLISRLATSLLAAAQTVALGHIFGPHKLGIFLTGLAIASLVTVWLPLGLDQLFIRKQVEGEQLNRFNGALSLLCVPILAIVALAFPSLTASGRQCLFWCGLFFMSENLRSIYTLVPQRELDFTRRGARELWTRGVIVVITSGVALVLGSPVFTAFTMAGASALILVVSNRSLFVHDLAFPSKHLLAKALPLAMSAVAYTIYFQIDTAMLAIMKSQTDTGFYRSAYSVMMFALVVPLAVNNELVRTRRYFDRNVPLRRLAAALALYSIGISAVLFIAAGPIIHLAVGPGFEPAVAVLRVLGLVIPIYALSNWLANTLVANERTKIVVFIQTGAIAFNVILNLWLIRSDGITGAAWATLITEFGLVGAYAVVTRGVVGKGRPVGDPSLGDS